ncbi:MAG TPA: hypothetical protein VHR85_16655 [Nocardioides sp.]|jgi:hypothetical protein|nr:hypothetical protein [Nocardioides sp.]
MSNTSPRTDYDEGSGSSLFAYGLVTFAGIMLAIISVFQLLEGIAAAANDKVYVRGLDYTYQFDVTAWGWFHIIIGVIGIATAYGVLTGQTWGRLCGIAIAGLSMLSNFAFMPYYPFWAFVIIAFDVFVIWALCHQISTESD